MISKKNFRLYFKASALFVLSQRGVGNWTDFFFIKKTNAKTVSWREDKCTEKFIMYLYNVGMVGWSMSHPETPYQVLCGDMSRKVPQ